MDNGAHLSYQEERIHTFDENASNGSLSDIVFVPNILILVSMLHCIMHVRIYK